MKNHIVFYIIEEISEHNNPTNTQVVNCFMC